MLLFYENKRINKFFGHKSANSVLETFWNFYEVLDPNLALRFVGVFSKNNN